MVNNGIQSSIESKDVPVWLKYILKKKPGQLAQALKMHNKIYNCRSVQSLYYENKNCCGSTYVHLNTGWIIAPNRRCVCPILDNTWMKILGTYSWMHTVSTDGAGGKWLFQSF
jgi:hypothetical protein